MVAPLKTGPWNLTDLINVPKNNLKVFSCFHCGGGSTMGYKLAGYDVIGGVEIDPEMMSIYRQNHNPKHSYLMGVQKFKDLENLPEDLYNLDILDGSPPCSSFSMAGSREKSWGEKKKFREGQAEQVLDDLFFDFIAIAKKLQPKVVIAENVKGLIQGNARGYVKEIFAALREAGYSCQLFLLNAAAMGVPQRRERTFFIANRLDKKIIMNFEEKQISVKEAFEGIKEINTKGPNQEKSINKKYYDKCLPGDCFSKFHPEGKLFNYKRLEINNPCGTISANSHTLYHFETMRLLSKQELFSLQTFPLDYNGVNERKAGYICGMSVPPFMMQRIADQIEKQFFK